MPVQSEIKPKAKKSVGLKELSLWQALLYPILFMFVAVWTSAKDRALALLLPKRRFSRSTLETMQRPMSAKPIRILVVDDNSLHQEISLRILQKSGLLADFACSGSEAIDACRKQHYDLVLMDIQMPDMSGIQAMQTIRRESHSKPIRIVAVTTHNNVDEFTWKASGMDGFLRKPLVTHELQKQLRMSSALRHSLAS